MPLCHKNGNHRTTSYNSHTNHFIGPSGESKTMTGNAIISGKDLLMMALVRFYKQNNNHNMYRIIPIIEGNCVLSLRLIDWFVTNYSKKYNTIIMRSKKDLDGMEYFNVYISYRQQLKAFSKQQFDPFRRRDRIRFVYDKENNWVETTIGQLNFFKWVLQNNILDHIMENVDIIEADMITSQKLNPKLKKDKKENDMNDKGNNNAKISKKLDEKSIKRKVGFSKNNKNENSNKDLKKGVVSFQENKNKSLSKMPMDKNDLTQTNAKISQKSKRKQSRVEISKFINIKEMENNNTKVGPKIVTFD